MGILIISIILAIVFGYIINKTNNSIIEVISGVAMALSVVAVIITGLIFGVNYFGKNVIKYDMQNRKERLETLLKETESPFYSTFKDSTMVFNNNMKSIKKCNESFWLFGLQSFVSLDTIPLK